MAVMVQRLVRLESQFVVERMPPTMAERLPVPVRRVSVR